VRVCSPIFSVPTVRTSKKQNGKSNTDSARYIPTADQPYSFDSFFSRALSDSDCSGAASPPFAGVSARLGLVEWKGRLGLKSGALVCARLGRAAVGLVARSWDINALWCHGTTGPFADVLLIHICFPTMSLVTFRGAALLMRTASNAPKAVRNIAKSRFGRSNVNDS